MKVSSVEGLIQAILAANSSEQPNIIELEDIDTFTLQDDYADSGNGLPSITGEITIEGNGSAIIRDDAAPDFRIFHVDNDGKLTLVDLIIRHGNSGAEDGGGIFNKGTLVLRNCRVSDNHSGHDGGGIYNQGTLKIEGSRLEHNSADSQGGAVYNDSRTGDSFALCAANRHYDFGGDRHQGIVLKASSLSGDVVWSDDVMAGLPKPAAAPFYSTWTYNIVRMYLDPFKPEAAYVFIDGHGVLHLDTSIGAVYYNPDWRNGGTWVALMTWQDIIDSGLTAVTDRDHCMMGDALVSFIEPGLCYFIVADRNSDASPSVIRLKHTNGGSVSVQYSPPMIDTVTIYKTYLSLLNASIALSHVDPNKVWVTTHPTNAGSGLPAVWSGVFPSTFPLDASSGKWMQDTTVGSFGYHVPDFLINPWFKLDGSRNLDTQMFLAQTYRSLETEHAYIFKSENHGAAGSWATWTADRIVPLYGQRDRFDVPGKAGMRAWWRNGTKLEVLKTTSPTAITEYTIPGFTADGFTLHWPLNPGQYYAAQTNTDGNPLLKFTYDADGGVWTDITGNMWEFLNKPNVQPADAAVVGFQPSWPET